MIWRPPRSTRTDTLFPYTTLFRSPDAQPLVMLIVNISAMGLMARCDAGYAVGDRLRITLPVVGVVVAEIRWSLRSEEHTSELQSLMRISYAVFCLKKKKKNKKHNMNTHHKIHISIQHHIKTS